MTTLIDTQAHSEGVDNNILAGKVGCSYYAARKASQMFFYLFGGFIALHLLDPADSIAGKAITVLMQQPGPTLIIFIVISSFLAIVYFRWAKSVQLYIDKTMLVMASGWAIHRIIKLQKQRITHVIVERSIFERRLSLATVKLCTPGSAKPTLVLANIDNETAEWLQLHFQG